MEKIKNKSFTEKIDLLSKKHSISDELKKEILEICKEAYITGSNDCYNIWVKKDKL